MLLESFDREFILNELREYPFIKDVRHTLSLNERRCGDYIIIFKVEISGITCYLRISKPEDKLFLKYIKSSIKFEYKQLLSTFNQGYFNDHFVRIQYGYKFQFDEDFDFKGCFHTSLFSIVKMVDIENIACNFEKKLEVMDNIVRTGLAEKGPLDYSEINR